MPAANRYVELAHTLWDELADFPVAHADEALRYLLERTCSVMDAHNACWIGAVRISGEFPEDPVSGWRPRISARATTPRMSTSASSTASSE